MRGCRRGWFDDLFADNLSSKTGVFSQEIVVAVAKEEEEEAKTETFVETKEEETTPIVVEEEQVKDAFTMVKNTVLWRKEFGIEGLHDEDLGTDLEKVVFMNGFDKEGHPVCYNVYGEFQSKELYQKTFSDEEKSKNFLRRNFVMLLIKLSLFLQDNYPEFVAKQIFINVPWWYLAFNRMISPFLTLRTKSKAAMAALDGHIYIFGGGNRDLCSSKVGFRSVEEEGGGLMVLVAAGAGGRWLRRRLSRCRRWSGFQICGLKEAVVVAAMRCHVGWFMGAAVGGGGEGVGSTSGAASCGGRRRSGKKKV
ncbi:hypothetical protein IFM89_018100 [Coptis chinensis]|uniref:CRAL-TRIO domain-containing protein n=1 Tax=Coptis chinensis TaxID=261450 RepID=A0A835M2U3_9MAGN|nr:hypothetical protein IFM89_018100 [Coptis chinensis]